MSKESEETAAALDDLQRATAKAVECVVADCVRDFASQIQHGDGKHRLWLLQAAEDYIAGNPIRQQP